MAIRIVCAACGSSDVNRDAWAAWDEQRQEWVLSAVFDDGFCQRCESTTTLEEHPFLGATNCPKASQAGALVNNSSESHEKKRTRDNLTDSSDSWIDIDDAPEWTEIMFAEAEVAVGEKVIRPARDLSTAAPSTDAQTL